VQLEEAGHGSDENLGKVVGDGRGEVLELVRSAVDGRDVGRERKERRRFDRLR
jgi:hypothetical protein